MPLRDFTNNDWPDDNQAYTEPIIVDDMEDDTTNVEELFNKLKEYGDTRLDLFKLKGINKVSGLVSTLIAAIFLILILFLVLVCLSIAISLIIGNWLGQIYYGFLVVTGIYIIVGLVVYFGRKKMLNGPISDKLIKELIN